MTDTNNLTRHDLLVLSAYTMYAFTSFGDIHEFIEEILERPVMTHELVNENVLKELQEKLNSDYHKVILKMNAQTKHDVNDYNIEYKFFDTFEITRYRCTNECVIQNLDECSKCKDVKNHFL